MLLDCIGLLFKNVLNDWTRRGPVAHGDKCLPHFSAVNNTTLMAGQCYNTDAEATTM